MNIDPEQFPGLELLEGALAADDRGELGFVNGFGFEGIRRFYTVQNYHQGFVRAWHAHKRESKCVTIIKGAALVGAVRIDDWDSPSKDSPAARIVLSASRPAVLRIPAGYANGFMSLTADATLMFFSSATLEESKSDDFRYDARYWNIWPVIER